MDKFNRRTFLKVSGAAIVSRFSALQVTPAAAQSGEACTGTAYSAGSYGAGRYSGGACVPMDVGVKRVSAGAKPRFWLHTALLIIATMSSRVKRITKQR